MDSAPSRCANVRLAEVEPVLIGESMGIHIPDLYKRRRLIGDIDTIIADAADLIAAHKLDLDTVRNVLAQDMLGTG